MDDDADDDDDDVVNDDGDQMMLPQEQLQTMLLQLVVDVDKVGLVLLAM